MSQVHLQYLAKQNKILSKISSPAIVFIFKAYLSKYGILHLKKNTKNAIPFANCVFLIIENYIYKYLLLDTTSISKNHLDSQIILEEELNKSLARMGVECVDLYYVHRRDPEVPIEEVAGTLGRLVKAGKTKSIGFSEIAPTSLRKAHAEHPVAAVQSEYSLSTRSPEMGLVQTCAELGVAMVAFSPVGRSLLTDNPLSFQAVQDLPFLTNNPRFMEPNYSANIDAIKPFRELASDMGLSTAGLAIAWLLAQGEHVIPIPGTRSVKHFAELLQAADRSLTDDELKAIDEVLPIGWAYGDRYSVAQWVGPEKYC